VAGGAFECAMFCFFAACGRIVCVFSGVWMVVSVLDKRLFSHRDRAECADDTSSVRLSVPDGGQPC